MPAPVRTPIAASLASLPRRPSGTRLSSIVICASARALLREVKRRARRFSSARARVLRVYSRTMEERDAPALDDALIGRTIAGKFNVEAFIGRGAMGVVYKARQMPLGRKVALKVMR